jgi:hypothetical protein
VRSRLGQPTNQEGGPGFNLFFTDHKRALPAFILTHGLKLSAKQRQETESFLDGLNIDARSPQPPLQFWLISPR